MMRVSDTLAGLLSAILQDLSVKSSRYARHMPHSLNTA